MDGEAQHLGVIFIFHELNDGFGLVLELLYLVGCLGVKIHFEFAELGIGFLLNGFLPGFEVVLGINRKLVFPRLYFRCDLHLFFGPGVLQDFVCLRDEMIFYGFLSYHFNDGGFEVSADRSDPGIDPRVEFVEISGQCDGVGCLTCDVGDETIDEQSLLGLSPGVNVGDSFVDGFVPQGVLKGSGF